MDEKGVFDVIDILNEVAIVIRCPHVNSRGEMFSGFSTYIEKHFVTFINSRYTLGHERFTAAHGLYHILYDEKY
ncbi:hypothetical protein KHA80_11825 [Anaerobacillus sp. HL2]|nr:hypothetical protein KHA80_11825 [Anaerobacillus sp. HL2]